MVRHLKGHNLEKGLKGQDLRWTDSRVTVSIQNIEITSSSLYSSTNTATSRLHENKNKSSKHSWKTKISNGKRKFRKLLDVKYIYQCWLCISSKDPRTRDALKRPRKYNIWSRMNTCVLRKSVAWIFQEQKWAIGKLSIRRRCVSARWMTYTTVVNVL